MNSRIVPFMSISNFRDLGGYRGHGGRTVRWHRLYRSDTLSRLAEIDWERFAALGIRTVVDLRRPEEIARDGRIPQFDGFAYRNVHLRHRRWKLMSYVGTTQRTRYLADRYRDLTEEAATGIAEALCLVAEEEAAPLVMHCLAGKDRTGVLSALVLALLGVHDDDIADDFALSEAAEDALRGWLRTVDATALDPCAGLVWSGSPNGPVPPVQGSSAGPVPGLSGSDNAMPSGSAGAMAWVSSTAGVARGLSGSTGGVPGLEGSAGPAESPTDRVPSPEEIGLPLVTVRAVGRAAVPGALPMPGGVSGAASGGPAVPSAVPMPGTLPLPAGAVPARGAIGRAPVQEAPEDILSPPASPREAILVFLGELRDKYGSVEGYADAIGVGPTALAALRTHLLA